MTPRGWILSLWIVIVLGSASLYACQVPVFRYALERWPADDYRVVAIWDGPRDDEALKALESYSQAHLNVETETIDLSQLTEAELWQLEGIEDEVETPILQVFYPERDGQRKLCWSGDLTAKNVDLWKDSPLRQRIIGDIESGASAVWILVDGTDNEENKKLDSDLTQAVASAADQIQIPDGVIPRQDAATYLTEHPESSMDDVLRSDIPLRIEFTIRRLSRDDDAELALWATVDGWSGSSDSPRVFPIFGRGRMIEPMSIDQFDDDAILAACKYMVGECSCSVKALNPGIDLMLDADWKGKLGEQIVMVSPVVSSTPTTIPIPVGAALGAAKNADASRKSAVAQLDQPQKNPPDAEQTKQAADEMPIAEVIEPANHAWQIIGAISAALIGLSLGYLLIWRSYQTQA